MQTGDQFRQYTIGPQIGQGGYGKIFAVRDTETGLVYALKHESNTADRKTLKFETQVLRRIQGYPFFPQLFDFGLRNQGCWCVIELCGPSLENVLQNIPNRKFSFPTAIRTSRFILNALRDLHQCGFIHRDIKPSNILIRLQRGTPLCLIDYGLARLIRNPKTGKPIPARQAAGFRGTKSYASVHAHQNMDLSRRDDLISWFYFTIDILAGGLPWKGRSEEDVLILKENWDIRQSVGSYAPQLISVWDDINSLQFEDVPHYQLYFNAIEDICIQKMIHDDDPYDWQSYIDEYQKNLTDKFGVALRIGGNDPVLSYREELGIPPALRTTLKMKTPLLGMNPQSFASTMDLSEMNEMPRRWWCC